MFSMQERKHEKIRNMNFKKSVIVCQFQNFQKSSSGKRHAKTPSHFIRDAGQVVGRCPSK